MTKKQVTQEQIDRMIELNKVMTECGCDCHNPGEVTMHMAACCSACGNTLFDIEAMEKRLK